MSSELPHEEASSVPWTGLDVLLIFMLWVGVQFTCGVVVVFANNFAPTQVVTTDGANNGHPLAQMIEQGKDSPIILLTAFFAAVIVVPIIEEFLFRMLLQGWLEAKLSRYHVPEARYSAIVAVSLFFAAIHAGNSDSWNVYVLFILFGTTIVTNLLLLTFGITFLKRKRQVPIRRYFFGEGRYFSPQFFSVAAYCLLVLILIDVLSIALGAIYPDANISPIPIFFFSLLLGMLYSKTQNLSYCILLHACLNGTSLALVWVLSALQ